MWLFSCRCDSPYEAGRRPGVSVFLAAARSAVPICGPGHQYRGQNKSRFRLEPTHFVKNKMRRFHHEISGIWAVLPPIATGNRSPLQIHNRGFSASNTVLLTCVMGNPLRPHPTFSQIFSAMADFRPNGIFRFGVASRAQHRFVSAFLPASLPVLLKRALRTWRVLRYFNIQFYSKSSSVGILRTRRVYTLLDNSLQFDSILPILSNFCNTFLKKEQKIILFI